MDHRKLMIITLSSGALAVALGAFGAHGLKPLLDESAMSNFQTANRYHFYHTFLAFFYLIWSPLSNITQRAAIFALIGILLFSGSLYLLALRVIIPIFPTLLGFITPIGGLLFVFSWLLGIRYILKKSQF